MSFLVSAIVSTYNSEKFIEGKIRDLLNQTIVPSLEIIIVNSGSQQNEDKIINEYLPHYSFIKYIRTEERETIYQAWNRGINAATGKYLTNANTDDRLRTDAYEKLSSFLEENKNVGLVYADQVLSTVENETFHYARKNKIIQFPEFNKLYLIERCIIGSQPMWRSEIHSKFKIYFNDKFEVSGDHEFELNVSHYYEIKHISDVLGTFYKSPNRTNKEYENIERNHNEVLKIQITHLPKIFEKLQHEEILQIQKYFRRFLILPIYLYFLLVKIERRVNKNIYPKVFKNTVEFSYLVNMYSNFMLGKKYKAIKIGNRFLRVKSSRIIKYFLKQIVE